MWGFVWEMWVLDTFWEMVKMGVFGGRGERCMCVGVGYPPGLATLRPPPFRQGGHCGPSRTTVPTRVRCVVGDNLRSFPVYVILSEAKNLKGTVGVMAKA